MSNYIFTYGLLMPGYEHLDITKRLQSSATKIGYGYILGAQLYDCGEYPAAVKSSNPKDKLIGYIYEVIDESVWADLDEFEGDVYQREIVSARLVDDEEQESDVQIYWYIKDISKFKLIESGFYEGE